MKPRSAPVSSIAVSTTRAKRSSRTGTELRARKAANSNHRDEAEQILNRAIEVDPDFWESYVTLFMLYNAVGNKQKAVEAINRYLERFPDKSAVREELENYLETDQFDIQKVFGQPG